MSAKKRWLSGYVPDGTVLKIRTAADYSFVTVKTAASGHSAGPYKVLKRHYSADAAAAYAQPGDIVVGLTEATLTPHGSQVTFARRVGGVTWIYPRCYACDRPGLAVCETFGNRPSLPACAGRHATPKKVSA